MSAPIGAAAGLAALRGRLAGRVVTAADDRWDAARQAFNLAVDQRPEAVVFPTGVDDVVTLVEFAAAHGLRLAPQRTGHNAGPLPDLDSTLLVRTDAMTGVEVDPGGRRARVNAGAQWGDLVPKASALGLAALHGSSSHVGVVGYTLGGGMGWYGRRWGMACNSVTAVEIVTAEGQVVRADADNEPELFWALRGGGGSFGFVTALEFRLYPLTELYAGAFFFPWERSAEVLHTWHALLADLPDEVTSCERILQCPSSPAVPETRRGRSFAIVEAAFLGDESTGAPLFESLRGLGPELDTFAMVPPEAVTALHMDSPDPEASLTDHLLLHDLPSAAIDDLVAVAGPGSGSPLVSVQVRHTGGAFGRSEPGDGALSGLPGSLSLFAVGTPNDQTAPAAITAHLQQLNAAVAPHAAGRYFNSVEQPGSTEAIFDPVTYKRLQAVKAAYDPHDLFRANHPVTPAAP